MGGAGGSSDTGTPGAGGVASSTLTVFDTSASQVTGSVIAIGGAGGSAGVGSGANGAAANVSVYVASSTGGAVKAIAQQVGGNGGSGFNGANGGAGADSNLATSPGSQVVTATTTGGAVASPRMSLSVTFFSCFCNTRNPRSKGNPACTSVASCRVNVQKDFRFDSTA